MADIPRLPRFGETLMDRLETNPRAPIDAASVSWIDDAGNAYDDFGQKLWSGTAPAQSQGWGDMALNVMQAPVRMGAALLDSINPYQANEHPITGPNASTWRVPPLAQEAYSAFTFPTRALNEGVTEDDINRSGQFVAGAMMGGGGLAARPAGSSGMFAGRLAKTADHAALAKAEELAAKGADRNAIWNETGWFQGADKKWRFEIDDSGLSTSARVKPTGYFDDLSSTLGMGGIVRHDHLLDAYPDLSGTRVVQTGKTDRTFYGQGDREFRDNKWQLPDVDTIQIGVQGYRPEWAGKHFADQDAIIPDNFGGASIRSLAAHELQHAVQNQEGFFPDAVSSGSVAARNIADYRKMGNEVEARNVQKRMNMSAAERRATPPWETQDIPYEDQIVRMLAANASKEAGAGALANALDMSPEARLARAREMGFDTDRTYYHGTGRDFESFDMKKANDAEGRKRGLGNGAGKVYLDPDPETASRWAMEAPRRRLGNAPNVIPTYVRGELADDALWQDTFQRLSGGRPSYDSTLSMSERDAIISKVDAELKASGYAGLQTRYRNADGSIAEIGQTAVFDPKNIRSVNAAFDPSKSDSSNLLAANASKEAGAGAIANALDERPGIIAYHGAKAPYEGDTYNPRKSQYKAFFAAESPEYASTFARAYDGSRVYPVEISPEANLFDYGNPTHTQKLIAAYEKNPALLSNTYLTSSDNIKNWMRSGDAGILEDKGVQAWLKKSGFDGWKFDDTAGPPNDNRTSYGMLRPGHVKNALTGETLYSNGAPIPVGQFQDESDDPFYRLLFQ